jgi:RNA polymerase sigma factor (sigma-70 family)
MVAQTDPSPGICIDEYAQNRIHFRVGRLARAFRLSEDEADDLRQEMVAALLKASPRFNPDRSTRNTFISRTLDRHYRYVARHLRDRRRHAAMRPTPISALRRFCPAINDPSRGEMSENERVDLHHDMGCALASMPPKLQAIAAALKVYSPREAAGRLGMHPSTVYRAIRKIRRHFIDAGLGGAE